MILAETELEMYEKYHFQAETALYNGLLEQARQDLIAARHWLQLFEKSVCTGLSNFYTPQDVTYFKSKLGYIHLELCTQYYLQGAVKRAQKMADLAQALCPKLTDSIKRYQLFRMTHPA